MKFVFYRVTEPDEREHIHRREAECIEIAKRIMNEYREVESVTIMKCETVDINKDSIIAIIDSGADKSAWLGMEWAHRVISRK